MALVYAFGGELNWNASSGEVGGVQGAGATITTNNPRSGSYAIRATSFGSGAATGYVMQPPAAAISTPIFFQFGFWATTLPTAENLVMAFSSSGTVGAGVVAGISIDNTGVFKLKNSTTTIGSASPAITVNAWNVVEIYINGSGGAAASILTAKLNGTQFASAANLTLASTYLTFQIGGNLALEAQTQGDWQFDDCLWYDNTGPACNSWPDGARIVHLQPDSAGDNNTFATAVGGTAGAANNFTRVDEVTPNDATDYNASNTLNQVDDYSLSAPPAEINANAQIIAVVPGFRTAGSAATLTANYVVRVKAASGGAVTESAATVSNNVNWRTYQSASPHIPLVVSYVKPSSSVPWNKTDLNSAQVGVRVSTGNTNNVQMSTMWLQVIYTNDIQTTNNYQFGTSGDGMSSTEKITH